MLNFKKITILISSILLLSHTLTPVQPVILSMLADGDLYALTTSTSGMYKMDFSFLKNELNVIGLENKDPRNIQLFTTDGQLLKEEVGSTSDLNLMEQKIFIEGEADGTFGDKDFILFYSEGPDKLFFDKAEKLFYPKKNIYSKQAHYILKFGNTKGKRIDQVKTPSINNKDSVDSYIEVQHYEENKNNLLAGRTVTYGSGKEWFGDYFKTIRRKEYTSFFNFQNVLSKPGKVKFSFAARSDVFTDVYVQIDQSRFKLSLRNTNTSDVEDDIAHAGEVIYSSTFHTSTKVILDYPPVNESSEGWLNAITLNIPKTLVWNNKAVTLHDPVMHPGGAIYKIINGINGLSVWDITDPMNAQSIEIKSNAADYSFVKTGSDKAESHVLFDSKSTLPAPNKGIKIPNQNLINISNVQSLIITPDEFEPMAKKLAAHREQQSGIKSSVIPLKQIYFEFSAGRQDPSAIRNFARALFLSNPSFQYLTLFGDGSYDYLGQGTDIPAENFIPVYETDESLSPIYAFPSDDFFALLEEGEGGTNLLGDMDIAVGRIPVRNKEEAEIIVNKLISYDQLNIQSSDWKLRIAFSADDEDNNIHLNQSESISNSVSGNHPDYNVQKIYLDAFKQESGAGGEIIPGANENLNNSIFQGLLVFNYLGHGSPKGLSQEGLLRKTDVEAWSNKEKLPLIITATCSFAPYDDPAIPSTGEALFRSPFGGAIALLTTVRNVYSSSNELLTKSVFDQLFLKKSDGSAYTLGEVMQRAKNKISNSNFDRLNARKFALIGDPTQKLVAAKYDVTTTHIQYRPVNPNRTDTIKSLEKLHIKGAITSEGNLVTNYTGIVHVSLFDKKSTIRTLGQNQDSYPKEFQIQNSILYKGTASVTNGLFETEFVIPKDIDFQYGQAKLSYYGSNGTTDASGSYEKLILGGSLGTVADDDGPEIKLYINDFLFKDGGKTHANPILLIDLTDSTGINASGNSIGHDLVATLDGKTQFVLNSFYESVIGNTQKGFVRFPLNNLSIGTHNIKVKAWDVANNSGEGEISFEVIPPTNKILSIGAVPNPFQHLLKVQFTHGLESVTNVKYRISLISLSGQVLYSREEVLSPAARTDVVIDLLKNDLPSGVFLAKIDLLRNGQTLTSQGIKLLRIP